MTMTISIACDDCGESAETSTSYDAGVNEIDGMLDDGWAHDGGEDYCPSCADNRVSDRVALMPDYPAEVATLPDDCDCEDREALVRPEGLVCGTCGKVIAPADVEIRRQP